MKHLKPLFILTLFLLAIFVTGCQDIEEDMETQIMSGIPVIGWFWRNHMPIEKNITVNTNNDTNDPDYISKLPDFPEDNRCTQAHQYWDYRYGTCMCESDYYLEGGVCISKSSRECTVDRDCSPNGQLSVCATTTSKRVYYCDLSTYKCVGGKGSGMVIDCKTEYGPNYKCVNGNCVSS